ncbi:MAG: hypothetical protein PHC47_03450 [Clostridia bacterium]|nr:hypothetical protein [Clostridia bacterium]
MNEILKYFTNSLSNKTLSLKKKGVLIEKPWTLIDDDGEIQKLIFKRDKGLILSKNGVVSEGNWDYYPEARALLIDRRKDKLLLKEQFIDNNVLILKKDGTSNDFFALANENTLPDLNIPKYLNSLKIKEFKIKEKKLIDGNVLQIYNAVKVNYLSEYSGLPIEKVDNKYNPIDIADGSYLTIDKKQTIFIKDNKINSVNNNLIKQLSDNMTVEIIGGTSEFVLGNKNKKVTMNGREITDQRLIDENVIFDIKGSVIASIYFVLDYELKNGFKIRVEQKNEEKISKGDIVVNSNPISPLPNGSYKIKGKWKKIIIIDNIIQ